MKLMLNELPRYDRSLSYEDNYQQAPDPVELDVPPVPGPAEDGRWRFCGLPVDSPLGIPAGPLLNGRWCLYYASLGFDVLTYKTVRSSARACYPLPNLQPVECGMLEGGERELPTAAEMRGSWAVSFGMPSREPDVWRADVERTRRLLPPGKLLSVSVVGSVQPGWSIEQLADDYARCAAWAIDAGADVIETNFSCPNVATCDGQLFQQPDDAALVAARVRERIGDTPLVVKIGHITERTEAARLLRSLAPSVQALAMTNSIAATVRDEHGLLFDGQPRGICGAACREGSIRQTKLFAALIQELGLSIELIGVGGAETAEHVRQYLAAGAQAVHIATAAMRNPLVGLRMRERLLG